MNTHRGNKVLTGGYFLVMICTGILANCATTHTVSVTVESKLGNDIGQGTIWSTYVGSGGPINCSNLATTEYNPQFDVASYNPQSYTRSQITNSICSAKFGEGIGVVLFSSPAKQGLLTGWTGPDCGSVGAHPCTVNITPNQPSVINVGAVFRQPRISVEVKGVALHADVNIRSDCRVGSARVSRVILHQGNNGTTNTGLPNDCDPHVVVIASPPPTRWTGTCVGNVGSAGCTISVTDDVSMTFDYGP